MSQLETFVVKGFNNLKIYCKISSMASYGKTEKNYTISFGGKNVFCFTTAIQADTPHLCYIDRVEYNNACAVDGTLRERGNTVQLVRLALWTIVTKFPRVTTITLIDDSYIYCNGENTGTKLSLSYDSIVKYNQTWYQRNFKAELPAYITPKFENSLVILDKPLESFEFMSTRLRSLEPYTEFYMGTPREFITNLRRTYGANYCFEAGPWLEQYITLLGVHLYKDEWFIRKENVVFPPNYSIVKSTNSVRGGGGTRKQKQKNFSLISHKSYGGWNNLGK